MDDFLDAVLDVETSIVESAKAEGRESGAAQAASEAYDLGLKKGAEFGLEFGFYLGAVEYLKSLRNDESSRSAFESALDSASGNSKRLAELRGVREKLDKESVKKVVSELDEMLSSFPRETAFDEETHGKFLKIRSKFKVLEARIGLVLDIQPDVRAAAGELESVESLAF